MPAKGPLEQPTIFQPRLCQLFNKGNDIGDSGCKLIAMAKWDNLHFLILSTYYLIEDDNNISEKGCMHLAKAQWNQLEIINLSIYDLIEISIKFAGRAANI